MVTCAVLGTGVTSGIEALGLYGPWPVELPPPAVAPSPRTSPCTADAGWHRWDFTAHVPAPCCPPSACSDTCWGKEELNHGNFFFPFHFLLLLKLLELCTSGSVHCEWFRFSLSPSLGDTFPESCCGDWPWCQQDGAPGSPSSLIPTANTQLGFERIASESSRSPH